MVEDSIAQQVDFMLRKNQRTWQPGRIGRLLVTVQLDTLADRQTAQADHELAHLARHLISLLDSHRLPATWAVSDPAYSAATPLVVRSAMQHELAVLGDQSWVGPTAGRTRFARELARRVSQARGAGLAVTTLVPRVASIERHIDLVVKQRITAVCGVANAAASGTSSEPKALHYGVWEVPVRSTLPAASRWLFGGRWSPWRRIRRAAHDGATYHLLVDAPAVAQGGSGAEKMLARLMRRTADLRDRGFVRIETLGAAAARLSDIPARSPQQSILRRAA